MELKYVIYVAGVILLGLLCNAGQTCYKKQGVEVKAHGQEIPDHESEESAATPEEWRYDPDDDLDDWRFPDELPGEEKRPENPDFFTAPDGRKVKYLENPLPGPKKHVSRQLDFDVEVNMDDMLAFDRKLDEMEERERKG